MTKAIIKIGDVEFEAEAVDIKINGRSIKQNSDVEVLLPGEHSRVCDCHDCMVGRTFSFGCSVVWLDEES